MGRSLVYRAGRLNVELRGVVRFRLDELEPDWHSEALEHREPFPKRHRLQHEAVFVDEPERCERMGEPGSSPRDQVLSRLALQVGDLVFERAADADQRRESTRASGPSELGFPAGNRRRRDGRAEQRARRGADPICKTSFLVVSPSLRGGRFQS
jgi:hypothetical protein